MQSQCANGRHLDRVADNGIWPSYRTLVGGQMRAAQHVLRLTCPEVLLPVASSSSCQIYIDSEGLARTPG